MRQPVLASLNTRTINDITPVSLPLPPKEKEKEKKNKTTNLYWNQKNLGCPDEPIISVPMWRVRVPPEWRAVRARGAWLTAYRKHPWYQNRSKQGAGWTAHWSSGTTPRTWLLCWGLPSGEKPIAWPPQEGGAPGSNYAQMGRSGLWAWTEVCTSKVLVWSRVCGEVGLVGQQMNQVLRRVSKDSNRDRKLNEMDRGDSHFIQKQNLREWKKKKESNHTPSLPHSAILLLRSGQRERPQMCHGQGSRPTDSLWVSYPHGI